MKFGAFNVEIKSHMLDGREERDHCSNHEMERVTSGEHSRRQYNEEYVMVHLHLLQCEERHGSTSVSS